jgi:hypothetical protein
MIFPNHPAYRPFNSFGMKYYGKGVFKVQFNVKLQPETFVAGSSLVVSGAGDTDLGTISWTDDYSTMIYRMTEDFVTISPCFFRWADVDHSRHWPPGSSGQPGQSH